MFHQIKLIPKENQALIAASGAVILWSTVAVGFKLGLKGLAPVQLLFAGSAISWVFFALLAAQRRCWWIADGERRLVVSLGLLNPLAYYLFLFEAYARLPAQIAQPLYYTWAIVLAILAVPLLGQQLTRRTATGVTVSYGGAVWLVSSHPENSDVGSHLRNPLEPGCGWRRNYSRNMSRVVASGSEVCRPSQMRALRRKRNSWGTLKGASSSTTM